MAEGAGTTVKCPRMKDYNLISVLGSGSYATVYKASRKGLKDKAVVAVKCIKRSRLTNASMENLLTEIKVMKQLQHQNVVQLLDFEWDMTYVFLVMEHCNSGDLSQFIQTRKTISEVEVKYFLQQLAYALQFLQAKGIAHMDLKPQNLLLHKLASRRYILKVGDFGMSQHLTKHEVAESFRGSPLYMAPEIMEGEAYDAKVDLWSVGVILFESLFGAPPFASETLEELQIKILDKKPVEIPANSNVSKVCLELLHGLLERDPQQRISFDRFFDHPFIDLDHIPSVDSLAKARSLVKQAVAKDAEGKMSRALSLYCEALEHFLPALTYEDDPGTVEALKDKITQYINRAEMLKLMIKENRPLNMERPRRVMDEMQVNYACVKAALIKAQNADKYELASEYDSAIDCYQSAVELLLPFIEDVESREEKLLLKSEVQLYLDRIEDLSSTKSGTPQLQEKHHLPGSKCKLQ